MKHLRIISIFPGNVHHVATITMSIFPKTHEDQELIVLDKTPENAPNTNQITPRKIQLIKSGVDSTLSRGPKIGCPVSFYEFLYTYFPAHLKSNSSISGNKRLFYGA